jgi:hypothetical protein
MLSSYPDNLSRQHRDRLFTAENNRISGLNVLGTMPLDDAEHVPSQEDTGFGSNHIPPERVEIVHPVRESETKASRTVPVSMPCLQITERRPQSVQRVLTFFISTHDVSTETVV